MSAELFDKATLQTEELEKNKHKLTFKVGPARFEEGIVYSYNRNKHRFDIPGFRKGRAPRKIIELQYGKEVLFDDAIDYVLDKAYAAVIDETGLDVVSKPEVDVEDVTAAEGVVFTAVLYTKPEVSLGDYKGITYTPANTTATDEQIMKEIETARQKNSRRISVSDRPAQMGDVVTIDFEGFVEGEAFEGGTGEDYELTLGSHTFIDTFEDQLVGVNIGESLDVNVTFPAEYQKAELSGKEAVFKVTLKEIRFNELPELDDDFAQDVSEFDTFAEYRDSLAAEITEKNEKEAKRRKENAIIDKLIARTTIDIPKVMIEDQLDHMLEDIKSNIEQSGIPFGMYMQYIGQDIDQLRESNREAAVNQVTARLALEAVAAAEGFEVSQDELDTELKRMANVYNLEVEKLKAAMLSKDLSGLKTDLLVQKAADLVFDTAVAE